MATPTYFYSFTEAVMEEKHNFASDTIKLAFCAAASAPAQTNSVLADLTVIDATNAGNLEITKTSSSQTTGTYTFVVVDKTVTCTDTVPTFRYPVIYNDSAPSKELICFYDMGGNVDLINAGDNVVINFDTTNNRLFSLAVV
jgi:hypothetical protein